MIYITYSQPVIKTNIYQILDPFGIEIFNLNNLPEGWDCGFGEPISLDMVNRALHIYNNLKAQGLDYEVMPFTDGTVKLTFGMLDHFLVVHILKNSYNYVYEKGIGIEYEEISENENVSLTDLKNILSEIKRQCSLLEPLISPNLAVEENGSTTVFRQWAEASPFLTSNVSSQAVSRYVAI